MVRDVKRNARHSNRVYSATAAPNTPFAPQKYLINFLCLTKNEAKVPFPIPGHARVIARNTHIRVRNDCFVPFIFTHVPLSHFNVLFGAAKSKKWVSNQCRKLWNIISIDWCVRFPWIVNSTFWLNFWHARTKCVHTTTPINHRRQCRGTRVTHNYLWRSAWYRPIGQHNPIAR